jgi:signal recognition particle subunit SRP54
MVLAELGASLTSAFQKLARSPTLDEETVKQILKEIVSALISSDVNVQMVKMLRENVLSKVIPLLESESAIDSAGRARLIEKAVVEELVKILDPGKEPYKLKKGKCNVIMFVGLQGAGKTTTVAKYCHYYQQRKWKVAMVCADTFRAGAFDQLKQNATKIRVPFYGSYTENDPVKIAAEGVAQFRKEGYELIIVDTSGRHKQETALFAEMEEVQKAVTPDDVVFVMDSSIGQAAAAQAKAFKESVSVGSVVITKLDGHAKGGGALSAVAFTKSPIVFIGTGEHFDALEPFNASRFIGKLLGRGDTIGLLTELSEKGVLDAVGTPEMQKRLIKGEFSLRDLREQYTGILKIGSLGKVLEMMPGMGEMMKNLPKGPNGQMVDPSVSLKRFLVIMDSMTADELDGVVDMNDTRAIRIIRGSGATPDDFQKLMMQFKQFEKMIGGMSKNGLLKQNENDLMKQMKRDPKQVMSQLQRSIDPNMLKSMGGVENMMEMMKGMGLGSGGGGGGGMPDMSQLAKMFGRK